MESSPEELNRWKHLLEKDNTDGCNNRVIGASEWHQSVKELLPKLDALDKREGPTHQDVEFIKRFIALDR